MSGRTEGFLEMERQMGDLLGAVEAFHAEAASSKEAASVLAGTQASLAQAVECLDRVSRGTSGLIGTVTEASEMSREVLARELRTLRLQQEALQELLRGIPRGLEGLQGQIGTLQIQLPDKTGSIERVVASQEARLERLSNEILDFVQDSRRQFKSLFTMAVVGVALGAILLLISLR